MDVIYDDPSDRHNNISGSSINRNGKSKSVTALAFHHFFGKRCYKKNGRKNTKRKKEKKMKKEFVKNIGKGLAVGVVVTGGILARRKVNELVMEATYKIIGNDETK